MLSLDRECLLPNRVAPWTLAGEYFDENCVQDGDIVFEVTTYQNTASCDVQTNE